MKKHIRNLAVTLLIVAGCNTEYRLYKRVGGDHLHISNDSKELFWFNGIHGHDPKNKMFADIKTEFNLFNPDVVLVEGHSNLLVFKDELSAIQSGETNYAVYLARQNKLPCFDLEPSEHELIEHMTIKYTKKEILSMYLIRQMIQWSRNKKNTSDFEYKAVKFLKWENRNFNCIVNEINMKMVSKLLKPYTGMEVINNSNWLDFNASEYLYFSKNKMNDIYNETSEYRNQYLLKVIQEKSDEYNRLFIMMGFDHAVEVNDELNSLFTD